MYLNYKVTSAQESSTKDYLAVNLSLVNPHWLGVSDLTHDLISQKKKFCQMNIDCAHTSQGMQWVKFVIETCVITRFRD